MCCTGWQRRFLAFLLLFSVLALLGACGPAIASVTPEAPPTPTSQPPAATSPLAPVLQPTATEPPTATPSPAPVPAATPVSVEPEAAADWLEANAVTLDTVALDAPLDDLEPLRDVIGEARVVGLGEGTHGTHEFRAMHARIVRFLVEEMGFTLVAMETYWPYGVNVDDYIHGEADADPNSLMANSIFQSGEYAALFDWLRAHNLSGATPPVSFHGVDPDYGHRNTRTIVRQALDGVDPDLSARVTSLLSCFPVGEELTYMDRTDDYQAECNASVGEAVEIVGNHEGMQQAEGYDRAVRGLEMIAQSADIFSSEGHEDIIERNQYMAENVTHALEQAGPDAKIIYIAHNFHVSTQAISDDILEREGVVLYTDGWHLRERFGDDYTAIATGHYEGVISTRGGEVPLQRTFPETYEYYFATAEIPILLLELDKASPEEAASAWLAGPRPWRELGAINAFDEPGRTGQPVKLPELYDALIFFLETTPAER